MPPPEPDAEVRARTRITSVLASPEAVAKRLEALCSASAIVRARRALLEQLEDTPPSSVVSALDGAARALSDGDEGLMVGFWARGEARTAGVEVPFDARGLERLGPNVPCPGGGSGRPMDDVGCSKA